MKNKVQTILVTLIIWGIISIVTNGELPWVLATINEIINNIDQLLIYTFYSGMRIIISLIITIILGVTIAIVMVNNRQIDRIINPLVDAWYPIPKATLTPIFIIVLGLGEVAKISLLVFVTIFPVIIAVRKAILSFPVEYTRLIRVYNIDKKKLVTHIYLKGTLRELLTTIKLVIGIAVAVLYLSESSFGASKGLGYYISRNMGVNQAGVLAGIIMLSLIGYALFKLVDYIDEKYIKW